MIWRMAPSQANRVCLLSRNPVSGRHQAQLGSLLGKQRQGPRPQRRTRIGGPLPQGLHQARARLCLSHLSAPPGTTPCPLCSPRHTVPHAPKLPARNSAPATLLAAQGKAGLSIYELLSPLVLWVRREGSGRWGLTGIRGYRVWERQPFLLALSSTPTPAQSRLALACAINLQDAAAVTGLFIAPVLHF